MCATLSYTCIDLCMVLFGISGLYVFCFFLKELPVLLNTARITLLAPHCRIWLVTPLWTASDTALKTPGEMSY